MTVRLHTGSRTVTIGADFLVWDVPCRVVLTDPWQLREARQVLRHELTALDRAARPWPRFGRRSPGAGAHLAPPSGSWSGSSSVAAPFPYGVTTAPANGVAHHRMTALEPLDSGRGRRGPRRLDPGPSLSGTAVQRCAEAVAEATRCGVLVGLGGDLACSGLAPAGGWRVALPATPNAAPTVLAMDGGALCAVGLPTGGPLRRLVVAATGRPVPPVWRHLVVLAATAPVASAAASGVLLRGGGAGAWLAECGLGGRLVDTSGGCREVGRWPSRSGTPVVGPTTADA